MPQTYENSNTHASTNPRVDPRATNLGGRDLSLSSLVFCWKVAPRFSLSRYGGGMLPVIADALTSNGVPKFTSVGDTSVKLDRTKECGHTIIEVS
ncbi:unnamed protein product [Mesocestoides corti]|uniref:Uncharacterized protein n=1 Tax=Mesocestoides corti TaxID=53468 RepID=A0A0R3URS9_MESCO|nr:unnamed protein product [Mesocestoides corti]